MFGLLFFFVRAGNARKAILFHTMFCGCNRVTHFFRRQRGMAARICCGRKNHWKTV